MPRPEPQTLKAVWLPLDEDISAPQLQCANVSWKFSPADEAFVRGVRVAWVRQDSRSIQSTWCKTGKVLGTVMQKPFTIVD